MPINKTPFCAKEIQRWLKVEPDGKWGKETEAAARKALDYPKYGTGKAWGKKRLSIALQQKIMAEAGIKVTVDGLLGPATIDAMERWANLTKEEKSLKVTKKEETWWSKLKSWWYSDDEPSVVDGSLKVKPSESVKPNRKIGGPAIVKGKVKLQSNKWPKQSEVPAFFGAKGANQVRIQLPYTMYLDWDLGKSVNTIVCHKKVAPSLQRIFEAVYQEFGDEEIKRLGLNHYGGCLNVRRVRGGDSWSMHSWGIAVDMDPDRNQFRWGPDKARLAKPDATRFWEIVEAESWVSLGRERGFDFMHMQATQPWSA